MYDKKLSIRLFNWNHTLLGYVVSINSCCFYVCVFFFFFSIFESECSSSTDIPEFKVFTAYLPRIWVLSREVIAPISSKAVQVKQLLKACKREKEAFNPRACAGSISYLATVCSHSTMFSENRKAVNLWSLLFYFCILQEKLLKGSRKCDMTHKLGYALSMQKLIKFVVSLACYLPKCTLV